MFENIIAERMERLHAESAFQILAEANALEAQGRSVIHYEGRLHRIQSCSGLSGCPGCDCP